jgi:hypothetical protein
MNRHDAPVICAKTKSPLSDARQRAINCVLINSAPHTRRRAMRVLMVVMALIQHEQLKLRECLPAVNF